MSEPSAVRGPTLRVVLADDHPLMLAGIRTALEEAGGFVVVGEVSNGRDVLPVIGRTNPDIALLDIQMPGIDGLDCLEKIRARHPRVKVIVLSVSAALDQIQLALARGACGYIVKTINPVDLPSAIRQAVEGTVYHVVGAPQGSDASVAHAVGLTERELTIVRAVARGLSNQAIAKELWVTEQTVKFHLTNIYRKLGIANRTEAAGWVYEHGLAERAFEHPHG